MLKDNKVYKKLVLRRDICHFVLEIREYNHILSVGAQSEYMKTQEYMTYVCKYSNWNDRLEELIKRADELEINPNYLDEYDDGLDKRVYELISTVSMEEATELKRLEKEINIINWVCRNAKSFCRELMSFYELWTKKGHPFDKMRLHAVIKDLLSRLPYDNKSSEYEYLMTSDFNEDLFNEWFATYLLREEIPQEEHQKNMNILFEKVINEEKRYALDRIAFAMNSPIWQKLVLSEKALVYLIDCATSNNASIQKILKVQKEHNSNLPFSPEAYIFTLFADFEEDRETIPHCKKPESAFWNVTSQKNEMTATKIGQILTKLIIPLYNLSESCENFIVILASQVALLKCHRTVAMTISEYLKTSVTPRELGQKLSAKFTQYYLESAKTIEESGQKSFVIQKANKPADKR